ncbi:MAG: hypothetical protein NTZ41_02790 [Sphingobacteriales bacterium]|jgi:hypothetical protein|nr:hypothetical protein [Sphingobacteriales bacterium]
MLTSKEQSFLSRWEQVRERESLFMSKLIGGLPMAFLFGLPILFSIVLVYWLSPSWYTKVASRINSGTVVILIAVLLIILFFSFTRMHFKWEMNEQLYLELKAKLKKEDAADQSNNLSNSINKTT